MPGTEDLYLSHAEGKMSKQYTTLAGPQKQFDTMLTYLEVDLGFLPFSKMQKIKK
jgi:hypothetical protein|tara:strand:- start:2408 stop:2572 length:165 start_codon:yes stop_codon:yes gene_type:complete